MIDIQQKFTEIYMKKDLSVIKYINEQKFDVALTGMLNYESFLAASADIPILRISAHFPNILSEILINTPDQSPWDFNMMAFSTSDSHMSFKNRALRLPFKLLLWNMENYFYKDDLWDPSLLYLKSKSKEI